jgi:hypothetical protein
MDNGFAARYKAIARMAFLWEILMNDSGRKEFVTGATSSELRRTHAASARDLPVGTCQAVPGESFHPIDARIVLSEWQNRLTPAERVFFLFEEIERLRTELSEDLDYTDILTTLEEIDIRISELRSLGATPNRNSRSAYSDSSKTVDAPGCVSARQESDASHFEARPKFKSKDRPRKLRQLMPSLSIILRVAPGTVSLACTRLRRKSSQRKQKRSIRKRIISWPLIFRNIPWF